MPCNYVSTRQARGFVLSLLMEKKKYIIHTMYVGSDGLVHDWAGFVDTDEKLIATTRTARGHISQRQTVVEYNSHRSLSFSRLAENAVVFETFFSRTPHILPFPILRSHVCNCILP